MSQLYLPQEISQRQGQQGDVRVIDTGCPCQTGTLHRWAAPSLRPWSAAPSPVRYMPISSQRSMRIRGSHVPISGLFIDVLTVMPLFVWGIVSLLAIVSYGRMQWFGPIACAAFTTCVCAFATWQVWQRTHVRAAIYIVMDDQSTSSKKKSRCPADALVALASVVITLVWGVLCIVANSPIAKAKALDSYPCGGECGGCAVDPHCSAWAANVTLNHPIVNICPPAKAHTSEESDVTFSCVADAAWMFLTCIFMIIWLICICLRRTQTASLDRVGAGSSSTSSGAELSGAASPPPSAPTSAGAPRAGMPPFAV